MSAPVASFARSTQARALRLALACAALSPGLALAQSHAGHGTAAPAAMPSASAPTTSPDAGQTPGIDHNQMKGMQPGKPKAMDHSQMPGMDHSQMQGVQPGAPKAMDHSQMPGMDHSQMKGMQPGKPKAMDDSQMPGMDHSQMQGTQPGAPKAMDHSQMPGMDQSQMKGMDGRGKPIEGMDHDSMSDMPAMDMNMQGGSAPPDARDPDAYSAGLPLALMPGMDMADNDPYGSVLIDQLEYFNDGGERGLSFDTQAWWGTDFNKLWLKAEGERSGGKLGSTRTEALWNRAIAPYWGLQLGVRKDFGDGPRRTWAAFGVQGLAPYWFDIEATAYVGSGGHTALRLEAEYELLLTQRLILQPDVEFNLYGKNDPTFGIGSGLSSAEVGLRLRYEIHRKFAPYIGVSWSRKFGNTADFARAAGEDVRSTNFVAGVRIWF